MSDEDLLLDRTPTASPQPVDADRGIGLERWIGRPYREAVAGMWGGLGIWDELRYDEEGCLWFGSVRLMDAVAAYGTPLEVVDARIVERRCAQWRNLAERVRVESGYPGRLDFLYAAKANMASEIAHAAYRAGWHAETSSAQDLAHLRWLRSHGLLPRDLRVVCNGFKLPPARIRAAVPAAERHPDSLVLPDADAATRAVRELPYAARIVEMAEAGWDICPILDTGELDFFAASGMPRMDVGLRAKFGPVEDAGALADTVSRFGMTAEALTDAAQRIAETPHLRWTTLHTMVGAAMTRPVDQMLGALAHAGRVYAAHRKQHPTLRELNMGGGVPPLGEDYDHEGLLRGLFRVLREAAEAQDVPPPDLTFEFGSLVAAEAGLHVFHVLHEKVSDTGGVPWAIVDGGLMAAIPDMLLIDKPFRILALNAADLPARAVRLGDLSCDSDGRYPPESFGEDAVVLLPETPATSEHEAAETWVAVLGVGAYQEILSGVRGAHHCGLLEAVELIVEAGPTGDPVARVVPRQTREQAADQLGYGEESLDALKRAMGRRAAMEP